MIASGKKFLAVTDDNEEQVPLHRLLDVVVARDLTLVKGVNNTAVLRRVLVEMLADPRTEFKAKKFSKIFGVPYITVKRWMVDPEINRQVRARIKEVIGGGVFLSKLYSKVTRQAQLGSFKHQRLLFEMTGEYTPGLKIEADVTTPEMRYRILEKQRRNAIDSTAENIE